MRSDETKNWDELTAEADRAAAGGSSWGRYGLPLDAIEARSQAEATAPAPDLSTIDMPDEMRETILALEEMIREAPPLPEPFEAWIGLELPPGADDTAIHFDAGDYVCLVGIVSATLLPEPALFAAGPGGALLHVRLADACAMKGELEKPGEMELIPPRNTCCEVASVYRSARLTDAADRVWERTVIEATQVPAKKS